MTAGKEERDLEHHRKARNEEVDWPFLEPIAFSLATSTMLYHRPSRAGDGTVFGFGVGDRRRSATQG